MQGGRLELHVALRQHLVLTPQLLQFVTLLQLNTLELREMIQQELMENPVLEEIGEDGLPREQENPEESSEEVEVEPTLGEEGDPFEEFDVKALFEEYMDATERQGAREREDFERPSFEKFLSPPTTLTDHLTWQLGFARVADEVRAAAHSIIGNLNEDGYLAATLEEISKSGEHEMSHVDKALRLIQEFDPLGVAARDLCECLLLQLNTLDPDNQLAKQIVRDHMRQLRNRQFKKIARAASRPLPAVLAAVEVIKKLDPRPGQRYNCIEPRGIRPDVSFIKTDKGYRVRVSEDGLPQLRLSSVYRRLLRLRSAPREVRQYVRERFTAATQLLRNIDQRKRTIERICEIIAEHQQEFLDHGLEFLRPLLITEVAQMVGLAQPTVSRAVANKYAQTPHGMVALRAFFSSPVGSSSGRQISQTALKYCLRRMVEEEDKLHPLSDEQIVELLARDGIRLSRRSLAGYRESIKIPSTHQRRVKS